MQMQMDKGRRHNRNRYPVLASKNDPERSCPEKRAPHLRGANDHHEYAKSDDITQGFVFHIRILVYVRLLFFIPFLFSMQEKYG